uniref:collagen alpha-1(I) chain-like n=1 Tax=Arvicanthis niloticus TaxID=61156 RepID=UPI001486EF39|nr:collagen alpha-1(I) chain-like [Arvicanthis niloticus]
MHGLIFETSICYWQDQPGREARAGKPRETEDTEKSESESESEKAGRAGEEEGWEASTGGGTTGARQRDSGSRHERAAGGNGNSSGRTHPPTRGGVRHPSARTSATNRAPASDRATAGAHTHALFPHALGTQHPPTTPTTTTTDNFFPLSVPPPRRGIGRAGKVGRTGRRAGRGKSGTVVVAAGEKRPANARPRETTIPRTITTGGDEPRGRAGRGTAGAGPGKATRQEPDNTRVDPPRDGHPPDKRGTPGPYSSRHGDAPAGCGGRSRTGAGTAAGPPSTRQRGATPGDAGDSPTLRAGSGDHEQAGETTPKGGRRGDRMVAGSPTLRARPPPIRGVRQHGRGSARRGKEEGERKNRRRAGRGERHGRTRAGDDDRSARDPASPRKAPHKVTQRPPARAATGHAGLNRRESHCTLPEQSRHHAHGTEPTQDRRAPGSPGRHQHERDRDGHTDADRQRPSSGSGSRRPTTRRTRPTTVPPKTSAPEGAIKSRKTRALPDTEEGEEIPRFPPVVGTLPRKGERGDHRTAREHTRHAPHARCTPGRGRGTRRERARAKGTHAADGTGGRGDGWDREPTAAIPTLRPTATLGVRGVPRTRASARPFPRHHHHNQKNPTPAQRDGRTTSSAPRDPSSNSERGGAGRGRRENGRCAHEAVAGGGADRGGKTTRSETEHGRQRRGTGSATTSSEAGTLAIKAGNAPGAPEAREKPGAHIPDGKGHAAQTDQPPSPVRGKGEGQDGTQHRVNRRDSRAPDAPTKTPRTTTRSARGSAFGPDSRTPAYHTPPAQMGRRDEGPAGRTRSAVAIRME